MVLIKVVTRLNCCYYEEQVGPRSVVTVRMDLWMWETSTKPPVQKVTHFHSVESQVKISRQALILTSSLVPAHTGSLSKVWFVYLLLNDQPDWSLLFEVWNLSQDGATVRSAPTLLVRRVSLLSASVPMVPPSLTSHWTSVRERL